MEAHSLDNNALDGMDVPIDPALWAEGNSLADMIAGVEVQTSDEVAEDAAFNNILHLGSDSEDSIFNVTGLEYVKLLSSINVVRTQTSLGELGLQSHFKLFAGNSRDAPTAFMYKCINSSNGCVYTGHRLASVKKHQLGCQFTTSITTSKPTTRVTSPRPFPCSECPKGYDTKKDLNRHVKDVHAPWVPRSCATKTCEPGRMFATNEEYSRHQRKYHHKANTDYQPTRCSYPDCVSETVFKSYASLTSHLLTTHKLDADQRRPYVPSFKKPAFVAQTCPVPCSNPTVYKHPSDLKKHLQSKAHAFSDAEVESYLIQRAGDFRSI